MDNEDFKVLIGRSPRGDSKVSEISISDISNVRWDNTSGGIQQKSSGYFLYGYISYEQAMELVDCSGSHDYYHNDAKVLIKTQKPKSPYYLGYKKLCEMAGPKPQSRISQDRPKGEPPCTKKILLLLRSQNKKTRYALRKELLDIGYQSTTIRNAIKRLEFQEKIICDGSPYKKNQLISLISS